MSPQCIRQLEYDVYECVVSRVASGPLRPYLSLDLCREAAQCLDRPRDDPLLLTGEVRSGADAASAVCAAVAQSGGFAESLRSGAFDSIGVAIAPCAGSGLRFALLLRDAICLPTRVPGGAFGGGARLDKCFVEHINCFRRANGRAELRRDRRLPARVADAAESAKHLRCMVLAFEDGETFCEMMARCLLNAEFVNFVLTDICDAINVGVNVSARALELTVVLRKC